MREGRREPRRREKIRRDSAKNLLPLDGLAFDPPTDQFADYVICEKRPGGVLRADPRLIG